MTDTTFQRARSAERKQERSEAFMAAARTVAARDGVHETTLVAIAHEVGLHHSAIRRYFASRDAVLLRLATDGWNAWADRLVERLDSETLDADAVVAALVETLVVDRLFCDLLGNVPLHLERNVDGDELLTFKRTAITALGRIVDAIAAACPALGTRRARDLMTAANSLAATLWQVCHPSPALADIYRREPELGHREDDFPPLLLRLLTATAYGLMDAPA